MFDKQTEKQVIVDAEAEERELGKAFPSFSFTKSLQLFDSVGPFSSSQNFLKWKSRDLFL